MVRIDFHFCRCHWQKSFESQNWSLTISRYVGKSSRRDLFESARVYLLKMSFQKSFLDLEIGIFGIFSSDSPEHATQVILGAPEHDAKSYGRHLTEQNR